MCKGFHASYCSLDCFIAEPTERTKLEPAADRALSKRIAQIRQPFSCDVVCGCGAAGWSWQNLIWWCCFSVSFFLVLTFFSEAGCA